MGGESDDLAARFARANDALIAAVDGRPAALRGATCPGEGWSVGTTARHLARSYPRVMAGVAAVAAGRPVPPITWEMLHEDNARHAREHAAPDRGETLAMLRRNAADAADAIRALPDADLERAIPWGLADDAPTSARQLIERHLIDHAAQHLAGIAAAAREIPEMPEPSRGRGG